MKSHQGIFCCLGFTVLLTIIGTQEVQVGNLEYLLENINESSETFSRECLMQKNK